MKEEVKKFLTLEEMLKVHQNSPKPKFLWSGIKEKSMGLIFGPSKSGKTIFCENLAMSLACGLDNFFGNPLDGVARKVLFVGLEEFWENRIERNKKQLDVLSDQQKELIVKNYMFQPIDFTSRIIRDEDWENLEKMIVESQAEVVFIDSITRMNPGKLENSSDAEKVMQRLRDICYRSGVTLICVHHTPKMGDSIINMDSIKGSSVFAQESDFAIAVTQTPKKTRYVKNVFFRYAADDDEKVKEFVIDASTWLNFSQDIDEMTLLASTDRRRTDENREKIIQYFDQNACTTFKTKELVFHFSSTLDIKDRQIKSYLSELVNTEKIESLSKGVYGSVKCVKNGNENGN
ncbi:AAA family ATPase [Gelidibacter sp.]|uniref:AAA family ATPase n=1 Tax=Gelidibacter sp. TaxID=2018083 RepID=UPI0032676E0C